MFFIVYDCGSCNDGDHEYGLESFETEEEARNKIEEIRGRKLDGYITLIEGRKIKSEGW